MPESRRKSSQRLKYEPFPTQAIKLKGTEGLYRIRVGDYRIIVR